MGLRIENGQVLAADASLQKLTATARGTAASADVTVDRFNRLKDTMRMGGVTQAEYIRQVQQLQTQLRASASATELNTADTRHFASAQQQMTAEVARYSALQQRTASGVTRAAMGVQTLTASMEQGRISTGGLSAALLSLSFGNPTMMAIIAGVSALVALYGALKAAEKGAADELERYEGINRRRLEALLRENQAKMAAGIRVGLGASVAAAGGNPLVGLANWAAALATVDDDMAALIAKDAALTAAINVLDVATGHAARETGKQAASHEYAARVTALHAATTALMAEREREQEKVVRDATEAWRQHSANVQETADKVAREMDRLNQKAREYEASLKAVAVAGAFVKDRGSIGPQGGGPESKQAGSDPFAGLGGFFNAGTGLQGLLSVVADLGPAANVAAGFVGILGDVLGTSAQAIEAMRLAQEQYAKDMVRLAHEVAGTNTIFQQTADDLQMRGERLRREAATAYGFNFTGMSDAQAEQWLRNNTQYGNAQALLNEWKRINDGIAALVARAAEDAALLASRAMEDLGVRYARATNHSAEDVDTYVFFLNQNREMVDAMRNGADAAYLARLQEVQLAEARQRSSVAIQKTIDELTTTIGGLNAFRLSLKFGAGSTASPMSQYAAARTEYQRVLAQALGGDQSAAGQLPEAARAFLDISRQINASGMAFQRDQQDVVDAVDQVTAMFQGQLDVQQRMLDALGEGGAIVAALGKTFDGTVAVLNAGFQEQSNRLDKLIDAVAAGNAKVSRTLEGQGLAN